MRNDRGSDVPFHPAMRTSRSVNPAQRVDFRLGAPAEMEPNCMSLLFSSLKFETVAELTGEESEVERPFSGVNGPGELLPKFRDGRRDGSLLIY